MKDILLFPHCYLTEGALTKILDNFETLRICLPWYMERPEAISKAQADSRVTILYPPESLKPGKDFPSLLSEYRLWMKENRGKALHVSTPGFRDEQASWEIRKAIFPTHNDRDKTERDRIVRWHLVLHLAAELEKENAELESSLRRLKISGSPLKEAMDDEDLPKGLLDDLPMTPPPSSIEAAQRLTHWLIAWFGLFSSHIQPESVFLTVNRDIFHFVLDLFGETFSRTLSRLDGTDGSIEKPGRTEPVKLPELLDPQEMKEKAIPLENLAGRSLHLSEDP